MKKKNKKSIALKALKPESDEEIEFEVEDFTMIARKLKKSFKKPSEGKKFINFNNKREKNKAIICLKCNKPSYIKIIMSSF